MLPGAAEATAMRSGFSAQDGDWIRQLGLHRAAKQIPRGWHLCRSPCCPPGAGQLGLEESQEASEK